MNYTVGDFLIRIKNAYMANKVSAVLPYSKENLAIGKILVAEGYLKKIVEEGTETKKLVAELLYKDREPAIHDVKLVSKPSLHRHTKKVALTKYRGGAGLTIISTSKGVMSGKQAYKVGVGGEVICQLF